MLLQDQSCQLVKNFYAFAKTADKTTLGCKVNALEILRLSFYGICFENFLNIWQPWQEVQ
jgi:hypothetical protein